MDIHKGTSYKDSPEKYYDTCFSQNMDIKIDEFCVCSKCLIKFCDDNKDKILNEIENNNVNTMIFYGYASLTYDIDSDNIKYLLCAANEKKNMHAMNILGAYYRQIAKYDDMYKYYQMVISLSMKSKYHPNDDWTTAVKNLGEYYHIIEKNYDEMKKYYLMAIEKGDSAYSMNNLGTYYHTIEKNYVLMKKYYLMAIDRKQTVAMINYAMYFYSNSDYDQMIKYFAMAINNGYPNFFPQKFPSISNNEIKKQNFIRLYLLINDKKTTYCSMSTDQKYIITSFLEKGQIQLCDLCYIEGSCYQKNGQFICESCY